MENIKPMTNNEIAYAFELLSTDWPIHKVAKYLNVNPAFLSRTLCNAKERGMKIT